MVRISARLLPLLLISAAPAGTPIEVAVSGVKTAEGRVHVDICPQKYFLTSDCPYVAEASAHAGTTIVTVANVPPGQYAVQAFHDRNGNGKIDRNFLGIPKEGVGFSRDAPTPMRAPHWSDAVFNHGDEPQHIGLTLKHFLG